MAGLGGQSQSTLAKKSLPEEYNLKEVITTVPIRGISKANAESLSGGQGGCMD